MNRRNLLRSLAVASAVATAPAFASVGDRFLVAVTNTPDPDGDVIDVAAASGQFTRFLSLVERAGYEETLRGEGPFTLFAPTDEAFRRMNERELERLEAPLAHEELLALLAYHVVAQRVTRESIGERVRRIEAANGFELQVDGRDGLRVNDQLVVMRDIGATNGIIQGVNSVLTPPVLVAAR